jgi:competence ComEA-like helix-hairpin-helix protein
MGLLSVLTIALLMGPGGLLQKARPSPEPSPKRVGAPPPVVSINQASADDFAKLPGIGPELARRIVTYREKHGPFRRVEDLLVIRGIGHKKWKAIRPYLKVEFGSSKVIGGFGRQRIWQESEYVPSEIRERPDLQLNLHSSFLFGVGPVVEGPGSEGLSPGP